MDLIDVKLPDFVRIAWVNDPAREEWAPRLAAILAAWQEIEWRAVAAGVRRCAVVTVAEDRLSAHAHEAAGRGLAALPLPGAEMPGPEGGAVFFQIATGKAADAAAFRQAWENSDDGLMAELLGTPKCCHEFHREAWVNEGLADTTWAAAERSSTPATGADGIHAIALAGPPETNLLWRWAGVRPVPHLPCSAKCAPTVELAQRMAAVGREEGFAQEMDWMREILSWPAEWSSLHGIAETRTPILKMLTSADATASKYVVRREGTAYPEAGARGVRFPFRMHATPRLTQSASYRRGIENPISAGAGGAEAAQHGPAGN